MNTKKMMLWLITAAFLTLVFALPLGLLVARGRMSKHKIVSAAVNVYIMIMRGTPLILQLLFVYFAPYYVFRASADRFVAVIIAFVINYAAYFAEIYRGGIQSISAGQYEAASVLGFSKAHTFGHIVMPQVVKRILPAMGNECRIKLIHEQLVIEYRLDQMISIFLTVHNESDFESGISRDRLGSILVFAGRRQVLFEL